ATGTRSVFVSWNGDASGTDPAGSRPIPMNGPRTVGTTWRTEYELRITSAYGSVVGAGWYQAGCSATASVNARVIGTAAGGRHVRGRECHRDDDGSNDRPGQVDDGDGPRRTVRHRAGANPSRPRNRSGDRASRRESAPAEGVTFREIPAGATPSSSCTGRTSR